MTVEQERPRQDRENKLYNALIPRSIFGSMTSEEMDKSLTIRLHAGTIIALFDFLEEESVQTLQGKGHPNKAMRESRLLASTKTVAEMLYEAEDNGMPVNQDLFNEYRNLTLITIDALNQNKPLPKVPTLLENRNKNRFDPFTRQLEDNERRVTELSMGVDQLGIVSQIVLDRFSDALGKNIEEGEEQFRKSVIILNRFIGDIGIAQLDLPVSRNVRLLIEASMNYPMTDLIVQRI